MQNRGGNLLPADCGLALRWVSTMLSHDFSPPFGEHVFIFFSKRLKLSKSMDPGPFFQKVMGFAKGWIHSPLMFTQIFQRYMSLTTTSRKTLFSRPCNAEGLPTVQKAYNQRNA